MNTAETRKFADDLHEYLMKGCQDHFGVGKGGLREIIPIVAAELGAMMKAYEFAHDGRFEIGCEFVLRVKG